MHVHVKTPWYHGWNIVGICILVQMAALGVMANCFSFFLEDWSRDFDMPISALVLAITLFSFPCAFLAPLAGWVVEKYSVSRVMLFGMLGMVLSHILIGFAAKGWQIIAIYALLLPVAVTFCTGVPSQTLVSRWFVRRRGLAFSLCALGLVAAGVVYPPIVVWTLANFGWRGTWWAFAAFDLVIICALILLVLRDHPDPVEAKDYVFPEGHDDSSGTAQIKAGEILSSRNFWMALLVFIPVLLVNGALSVNFAPFVKERSITGGDVATLMAIFNIAAAAGKLGAGAMADRYGNRLPLFLLATSTAAGTFLLIFVSGMEMIAVGFVLMGAGQGVWVLLASCMASEFGSRGFARAYGLANMSALLTTLGAPALAFGEELTHSYTIGLVALGLGCVIGIIASLFFSDRRRITPLAVPGDRPSS